MNTEKINIIKEKYGDLFEDHVSCNLYHDPVTDQMNQYPVFTIKFAPLFESLGVRDAIESNLTSYSPSFVEHIEYEIENYINNICVKALQ